MPETSSFDLFVSYSRRDNRQGHVSDFVSLTGLLVRPEIARRQIDQETTPPVQVGPDAGGTTLPVPPKPITPLPGPIQPPKPRRYHGTVILDSARVGRDAGRIADEVVTHLVGLIGSSVRVTLEIEAEIPEGAPGNSCGLSRKTAGH